MKDGEFVTQNLPKTSWAYCFVAALFFEVLFVVAFRIFPQFQMQLFLIGALLCIGCLGAGIILSSYPPVILRFKNDELYISDSSGEYNIYAVSADDFVFIQTPLEKKYDMGCLIIKHTVFFILGVTKISETKRYVNEHFLY